MKTCIIEYQSGASQFVRGAWAKVLQSIGYQVILWDRSISSAFDIFNNFHNIDIFLGTTFNLDRATIKCIKSQPNMKVALFCSAWGELTGSLDRKEYPIDYVTEEEKRNVSQIADRLSCVFIHITDNYLERCIGGWRELGVTPIGLLNGADVFTYYGAKPEEKYKCDVGFVGGYWPYKAKTLDKYMVRLCREEWKNFNVKIYGSGWGIPQHLGNLSIGEDAKVFASSKICPNISELHSTECFPDLIERIFKVPCADGFLICDNVDLSEINLAGIVPQFSSYNEFLALINYFTKNSNEKERLDLIAVQKYAILENHTYHHRMYKLLNQLGFPEDADKCLLKLKQIIGF